MPLENIVLWCMF